MVSMISVPKVFCTSAKNFVILHTFLHPCNKNSNLMADWSFYCCCSSTAALMLCPWRAVPVKKPLTTMVSL